MRLVHNISQRDSKEKENVDFNNKKKNYVKIDKDTKGNKKCIIR